MQELIGTSHESSILKEFRAKQKEGLLPRRESRKLIVEPSHLSNFCSHDIHAHFVFSAAVTWSVNFFMINLFL